MSTLTTQRPRPSPSHLPGRAETEQARAARLALRRRLVVGSLPGVAVLLLVALKLLTMVAAGAAAGNAYAAGNITGVEQAAARMGFLNIIESYKAPFARGDGRVLVGDFDGARAAYEEALAMAPRDAVAACKIRVNLVLSLEKLGDAAGSASGAPAAKPFFDRVQQVVDGAPKGCFQPQAGDAGQRLTDARSRAQAKSQPQPGPQSPPDPNQQPAPSQDKQQQLDDKTKDNQQQRSQSEQNRPGGSRPPAAKPW